MNSRKKRGTTVIALIAVCVVMFGYMALAATRPAYPFGAVVPLTAILAGFGALLTAAYPGPAGV